MKKKCAIKRRIRLFIPFICLLILLIPRMNVIAQPDIDMDKNNDSKERKAAGYLLLEDSCYPEPGDAYGWLWSDKARMMVQVFWGDSEEVLEYGAGTCMGGMLPGEKGPVILAGHVLSFFHPLKDLREGDLVHLDTWYGSYVYEIIEIMVYDQFDLQKVIDEKTGFIPEEDETHEQSRVFLLEDGTEDERVVIFEQEPERDTDDPRNIFVAEEDNRQEEFVLSDDKPLQEELILYTCYPFYPTKTEKTDRYTLIARKVAGPAVIWAEEEPKVFFSE